MKIFLDSSFLIYLNASTDESRKPLEQLFKKILPEELYTNILVIDETLYISRKKYKIPYDLTFNFIKHIILPYTEIIPIEKIDLEPIRKYLIKYEIKPSDAIHLATMEKKGINNIVSEDEDFDKIKGINRIWLNKI